MHLHRCVTAAPSANPDFLPFDRAESTARAYGGLAGTGEKALLSATLDYCPSELPSLLYVPGLTDNFSANFHPLITTCDLFTIKLRDL